MLALAEPNVGSFSPYAAKRYRLLSFTTLYPSVMRPRHGIFVETRLRKLVQTGQVDARVLAPVPWFPSRARIFGDYAKFAGTPPKETLHGLCVQHPRYLTVPKIGMYIQPASLAWSCIRAVERLVANGFEFDIIDAHYFYPDGVAASYLAERFRKPFIVTARGSDINFIARMDRPRRRILDAALKASAVVAVSQSLKEAIIRLGVPAERVRVVRNGVDLDLFYPVDRSEARAQIGMTSGCVVLSVGNLVKEKGHDLVLRAAARLPHANVLIVGEGEQGQRLRALAGDLNMSDRVVIMASVPQNTLRGIYSAADVVVLASEREGWPNVLLEALACGTPVVATTVGGVPEIVQEPFLGRMVGERTPEAFREAIAAVLSAPPDRAQLRRYANAFGWDEVTKAQLDLLREILE